MELTPGSLRRLILEQVKRSDVGHAGSALSISDICVAIYGRLCTELNPGDTDRDRIIISKGHAALAAYCAMRLRGLISSEQLNTFCGDGTLFGVHPDATVKAIDFSTGSLGHGLSMGVGAALAGRISGSSRRVYVVLSDGECNEGSVWEAAMFAAHHKLANIVAFIDSNGQQSFGYANDVLMPSSLEDRWAGFGWDTRVVDGHDVAAIVDTAGRMLAKENESADDARPHVLICNTTFGSGVSFMEGQIKWHYSKLSDEQFQHAIADIARFE